jgi:hypothetical protein
MKYQILYPTLGGLFGLLLALLLLRGSALAVCGGGNLSDACSTNFGLRGTLTAIGSAPSNSFPAVDNSQLPAAGALFYADYQAIEAEARRLLARNLTFRLDISPYKGANSFDQLVRQYDIQSGFQNVTYDDPSPSIEQMTLQARIDLADSELRQARDLYAFLAVYAPAARMRSDNTYTKDQPPGFTAPLCGEVDKENPNPPDPQKSGQVIEPVIDWCNFGARLRQSVREAALIRMIFAQEFMVDALGLQFGSNLLGGETIVRKEIAQLQAAHHQYELAEAGITEALERRVGNGCLVSDFFKQADWSLLSRIGEGRTTAQQHIAMRRSYLDINQPADVEQARAAATDLYRTSATEGYLKMVGLASKTPTAGCNQGERPDGSQVAGLALTLLETQRRVRELNDGRNAFGFDVHFTPARLYYQEGQTQGLWNEAMTLAQEARKLEENVNLADRAFDLTQEKLLEKVQDLQRTLDMEIANDLSCSRSSFSNDADFFACADRQIEELNKCVAYARYELAPPATPLPGITSFDQCVARKDSTGAPVLNAGSTGLQTLAELRNIFLEQHSILKRAENIDKRIKLSNDRNAIVNEWLLKSGIAQTAAEVSGSILSMIGAQGDGLLGAIDALIFGSIDVAAKSTAGALSTQADIAVENAENNKEIQNLLLDQTELLIDAVVARQAYAAKLVEYEGVIGHMEDVILQTQRQRAHLKLSPGNDPSYRMLRDSYRLSLADALVTAAKVSYLAARRAEYEYAARLSASNFRISDIYRARTAGDIIKFLNSLRSVTNSLGASISLQPADFKLSVAQHVLGLTDAALTKEGFTTPAAIAAERTRRFRQWVSQNTALNTFEPPFDNKAVLRFGFTTSVVEGGVFSQLLQQSYDRLWLLQMGGVGAPVPSNTGLSVNLLSAQPGLSYRTVAVTQDGLTHLRARSGCVFDFRLMSPAALMGQEWASNQDPAAVTAVFRANINGANPWISNGFRTASFQGRPVSATNWQVLIKAGAPENGMVDMDLQQLTDIELNFSTTYGNRTPGTPALSECTRIDY